MSDFLTKIKKQRYINDLRHKKAQLLCDISNCQELLCVHSANISTYACPKSLIGRDSIGFQNQDRLLLNYKTLCPSIWVALQQGGTNWVTHILYSFFQVSVNHNTSVYNGFLKDPNMKINKEAMRESIADTMLGALFNFPLSWLTITIVLLFTHNSFIISLSQLIVLSLLAIIRRYYTRVYFDKKNKRNGK